MRQKAQIFLIMTILVVSFMIGITTVLLDVQRANFLDPAPQSTSTLEAWELTVDSITQILDVQLAADNSNGVKDIDASISDLGSYLNQRGIANSIIVVLSPTVTNTVGVGTNDLQITATFSIFLSSSSASIEQTIEINISYSMSITATTIEINRSINGNLEFISEVTFTDTDPANDVNTDLGNGSYLHTVGTGQTITATTPNKVILSTTVP